MFALPTKGQVLTLLIIILLNQLAALAHACEITPADWAEVEEEMSDE